jgi:hypothetical protein
MLAAQVDARSDSGVARRLTAGASPQQGMAGAC